MRICHSDTSAFRMMHNYDNSIQALSAFLGHLETLALLLLLLLLSLSFSWSFVLQPFRRSPSLNGWRNPLLGALLHFVVLQDNQGSSPPQDQPTVMVREKLLFRFHGKRQGPVTTRALLCEACLSTCSLSWQGMLHMGCWLSENLKVQPFIGSCLG